MRIRSIKPEFWRSDDIDRLNWDTRLVFIGVWSYVDDNGVGLDKLPNIVADLFAHDFSIDPTATLNRVSTALNMLAEGGQITRYSVAGKRYLHVTNWEAHQRVNNPNKPRYPSPTSENAEPTENLNSPALVPNEETSTGAVEQWSSGAEEIPSPAEPVHSRFDEFWDVYPRKVGKLDAQKAYAKAVRAAGPDRVLAGARRLAADPNLPDDRTLIPHAATWLNGGRWDDEPYPPKNNQQTNQRGPRIISGAPGQMRMEV
jgi:hypothetical protein